MINNTCYTTRQIRAYIKWKGWKFQPSSHWERDIHSIVIESFDDSILHISYQAIVVYTNDGARDVIIPLAKFHTFINLHDIPKPKRFRLHGNQ